MASKSLEFGQIQEDPMTILDLQVGDQIVGISDVESFDTLFDVVQTAIQRRSKRAVADERKKNPSWIISDLLAKRKFYGAVRDLEATVVSNQLPEIPTDVSLLNAFRTVTESALYSTGKGQVGRFVFDSRFCYRQKTSSHYMLSEFTKGLANQSDLSELDLLVEAAQNQWLLTYWNNLSRTIVGSGRLRF